MSGVEEFWNDCIVPCLIDYIRIPAKSPHFDKSWAKNGHIDAAVELAAGWCRKNAIEGMRLEVVRLEGRTPLLFIEVPATRGRTQSYFDYGRFPIERDGVVATLVQPWRSVTV